MGEERATKVLPISLCIGFGLLWAATPMTSVTEIDILSSVAAAGAHIWVELVVFVVAFALGMAALSFFGRNLQSVFQVVVLIPAASVLSIAGILLYCFFSPFLSSDIQPVAFVSAILRGVGCGVLTTAWIELMVDSSVRVKHASIVLPLALLVVAVGGIAVWLVVEAFGVVAGAVCVGGFTVASVILLYVSRSSLSLRGIKHLSNTRTLDFPKATIWIVFAFGLSLGCMWVLVFNLGADNVPLWCGIAFVGLGIVSVVGYRSFMVTYELEFGYALRVTTLFAVCAFLLAPVLMGTVPAAAAFFLGLAWATQVLLLALLPIQISSKLPVNMLSVAAGGAVPYAFGVSVGSFAAGQIVGNLPGIEGISAVTALACIALTMSTLFFPSRKADASQMGMKVRPGNELYQDKVERRCTEVAQRWSLTPREQELMQMLVMGKTRSKIAEELVISEETVKTHVKHIYEKLDVHSLRELVMLVETGTL